MISQAGVVLQDPDGTTISISFRLEFPCSDNVAECEALVMGLISAFQMGIQKLRMQGDFKLVTQQIKGKFSLKEAPSIPIEQSSRR